MTARAALAAFGVLGAALALAVSPAAAARKPPPAYRIVRSAELALPAHARQQGEAVCPGGTVPWGGGVITESPDPAVVVSDSFPDTGSWLADVSNPTGSDTAFQVSVVCARRPAGYAIVQGTGVTLPRMMEAGATATCPAGTHPLSGGGFTTSGATTAINSSGPDGFGWAFEVNNPTASEWLALPYAICGHPRFYRVVKGASFAIGAGSRLGSQGSCPAPFVVSGGGVFAASSDLGVNVAGTEPIGRTIWGSFVANDSAFGVTATPEAVCVHA
jgi:hypothetical protein